MPKRATAHPTPIRFTKAAEPVSLPALAVGVDVTWWGGSGDAGDPLSRKECVASALKTEAGWGLPEFSRIDLTRFDPQAGESEPNADPDGEDLVAELRRVFDRHTATVSIVVASTPP